MALAPPLGLVPPAALLRHARLEDSGTAHVYVRPLARYAVRRISMSSPGRRIVVLLPLSALVRTTRLLLAGRAKASNADKIKKGQLVDRSIATFLSGQRQTV